MVHNDGYQATSVEVYQPAQDESYGDGMEVGLMPHPAETSAVERAGNIVESILRPTPSSPQADGGLTKNR